VDLGAAADGVDHQLGLVGVAAIDGGLADAGPPGDAFHRDAGVAGLDEHVQRRPQNGSVAGRVPRSPGADRDVVFGDGHDATPTGTAAGSAAGCSSRARAGRNRTTPMAAISVMPAATSPIRCRPPTKLLLAAVTIWS